MRLEYERRCDKCNRVIQGVSEGQFEWNWKLHQDAHGRRQKKL